VFLALAMKEPSLGVMEQAKLTNIAFWPSSLQCCFNIGTMDVTMAKE